MNEILDLFNKNKAAKKETRISVILKGAVKDVSGLVVSADAKGIELKMDSGSVWNVTQDMIGMWKDDAASSDKRKFPLLYCMCEAQQCHGVQVVSPNSAPSQADYKSFMEACPCHSTACKPGIVSDFRIVSDKLAERIFSGTMLGQYPDPK
jgi:hypothetical protein